MQIFDYFDSLPKMSPGVFTYLHNERGFCPNKEGIVYELGLYKIYAFSFKVLLLSRK